MRLDTSPDRAGQQELRTVTKRSQGPMFRAHEDGFIRCRLARCAAKDLVAAELPPPDRSQSAPEMPRSLFSCPQEPRPQTVERERGRPARARWRAQAWPTDGNCRRSPSQDHPFCNRPAMASGECRGKINRARLQSPIGFGLVSSESAIIEVRMRRRYSFTNSGRLRAVPAASTSIMAMKTSREAEGL